MFSGLSYFDISVCFSGVVFGAQPIVAILGSTDGSHLGQIRELQEGRKGEGGERCANSGKSNPLSYSYPVLKDKQNQQHGMSIEDVEVDVEVKVGGKEERKEEEEEEEREEGYVLCLENSVFPEDMNDEDETEEVLEDLHSLCQVFGDISTLWIEKVHDTCTYPLLHTSSSPCPHPNPHLSQSIDVAEMDIEAEKCSNEYWILIEFEDAYDAEKAVLALNGICVGGEYVQAGLYSCAAYLEGIFNNEHFLQMRSITSEGGDRCQTTVRRAVVAVRNYISKIDIEECAGDSEELGAIKRPPSSLLQQCQW